MHIVIELCVHIGLVKYVHGCSLYCLYLLPSVHQTTTAEFIETIPRGDGYNSPTTYLSWCSRVSTSEYVWNTLLESKQILPDDEFCNPISKLRMLLALAELLSGEAEVQVMGEKKKSTRLSSNSKVNFTFCIVKTSLWPIALVGKVIY